MVTRKRQSRAKAKSPPPPAHTVIDGRHYAVRVACGRLVVRDDNGRAETVDYLRDEVEGEILIAGDLTAGEKWEALVAAGKVVRQ